jgi:integrase
MSKAHKRRGHVSKRSDGRWIAVASRGFDPLNGKRQRLYSSHRTRAEAEQALTTMLRDSDQGRTVVPSKLTVAEYLTDWLAGRTVDIRRTTWASYESMLRVHVAPALGRLKMQAVTPLILARFYASLLDKGLSRKSVLNVHLFLRVALADAVEQQLIPSNPAGLKSARPPRPGRPILAVPDREAAMRVLRAAAVTPYAALVALIIGTGLRRGEALALAWDGLNLDSGRLRVTRSLTRLPKSMGGAVLTEPKTARGRRELAIPPFAVEALRRHKAEQNSRRLALGDAWTDDYYVFDDGFGGALKPDTVSHAVKRIIRGAGLPDSTRLHDLRHGFATEMLSQGVHPAFASAVLGHSSPAFTMTVYQHVLDGMQDRAADAAQRAYGQP